MDDAFGMTFNVFWTEVEYRNVTNPGLAKRPMSLFPPKPVKTSSSGRDGNRADSRESFIFRVYDTSVNESWIHVLREDGP